MSIFKLPYEEYIKAREKLLEAEAAAELVRMRLVGDMGFCIKNSKLIEYRANPHSKGWWQSIWLQQYEMQGGVV